MPTGAIPLPHPTILMTFATAAAGDICGEGQETGIHEAPLGTHPTLIPSGLQSLPSTHPSPQKVVKY